MKKENVDSIIFDLDGTLWDSLEVVIAAWNNVLLRDPEVNREITVDELRSVTGMPVPEIGKRLLPTLSQEKLEEILEKCNKEECLFLTERGGKLYDQLEHVLETLARKYKLFIVSNCQKGYIESFFAYHQLGKFFTDYENPGRTGLSKGENIKLVIERNNLQSPVYVGDTEGDRQAARYAGIPFIYAGYGFGQASEYDHAIERLDQLLELF